MWKLRALRWPSRLPMIHQSVSSECGVACVAMISCFYGRLIDINTLRNKGSSAVLGLTLKDLRLLAQAQGLSSKVKRIEVNDLARVRCPAILHWGLSHFVVVQKVRRDGILIHDPSRGIRLASLAEVEGKLSGICVEFSPTAGFVALDERRELSWANVSSLAKPYYPYLLLLVLLAASAQVAALALPQFLQRVIDRIIPSSDILLLGWLACLFLAIVVIDHILRWIKAGIAVQIGVAMNFALSERVYLQLLRLPISFFTGRAHSDLQSKMSSLAEFRRLFVDDFPRLVVDASLLLLCLVFLFHYPAPLGAIAVATAIAFVVMRFASFRKANVLSEDAFYASSREQAFVAQTLYAIKSIKANHSEQHFHNLWKKYVAHAHSAEVNSAIERGHSAVSRESLVNIESVLSFLVIGYLGLVGKISNGEAFAYLLYKRVFLQSALSGVEFALKAGSFRAQLNRLSDVMLNPVDPAEESKSGRMWPQSFNIEAVGLSYSYGDRQVLHSTDFHISNGQSVVLVGPSGAGKTTLIHVFLRLLPLQSGSIMLNGANFTCLSRSEWLEGIGYVAQNEKLLAGSVRDNITMFSEDSDEVALNEAMRMSCIDTDVGRLPMGTETMLQDDFSVVSGGQRQRILLARALYRRPRLLVLDEGTAHLDESLEMQILNNLRSAGIAVLHCAHRPQVIAAADRIVQV